MCIKIFYIIKYAVRIRIQSDVLEEFQFSSPFLYHHGLLWKELDFVLLYVLFLCMWHKNRVHKTQNQVLQAVYSFFINIYR